MGESLQKTAGKMGKFLLLKASRQLLFDLRYFRENLGPTSSVIPVSREGSNNDKITDYCKSLVYTVDPR